MTVDTADRTSRPGSFPGREALEFEDFMGADGRRYSTASFRASPILVLVFVGNACPSVKAYGDELRRIDRQLGPEGVQIVAINSNNDALSPPDTFEQMVEVVRTRGWDFPYLKDRGGDLARRVGATTTPHAFVFDGERTRRYQGRLTDSRDPARAQSTDLLDAVADLQADREVQVPATQPIGCSIVW